jgi:hypothetical protein
LESRVGRFSLRSLALVVVHWTRPRRQMSIQMNERRNNVMAHPVKDTLKPGGGLVETYSALTGAVEWSLMIYGN